MAAHMPFHSTMTAVFSRLSVRLRAAMLLLLLSSLPATLHAQADPPISANTVRVHYHRTDGNYSGWTIYAYDDTTENTGDYNGGPVAVTGTDAYGAYFDVGVIPGAQNVGLIIHNPSGPNGDVKDPGDNEFVDPATEGYEYWAYTGIGKLYKTMPSLSQPTALLPGYARIHYHRPDNNYANWTVYAFQDTEEYTGDFNDGLTFPTGYDSYGAYYDISLTPNAQTIGVIVHNVATGVKDPGPNQYLNVSTALQGYVISGDDTLYTTQPTPAQLLQGTFNQQQAYWIDRDHILIQPTAYNASWKYSLTMSQNQAQWPLMTPLLSESQYAPRPEDIAYSAAAFKELLQIRYSCRLFRMPSFSQVQNNLTFLNTGADAVPGVIVMKLDAHGGNFGPYTHVVVIFNGTDAPLTFTDARLQKLGLRLHPVQVKSADSATRASTLDGDTGTAQVAPLTTAVFVSTRP